MQSWRCRFKISLQLSPGQPDVGLVSRRQRGSDCSLHSRLSADSLVVRHRGSALAPRRLTARPTRPPGLRHLRLERPNCLRRVQRRRRRALLERSLNPSPSLIRGGFKYSTNRSTRSPRRQLMGWRQPVPLRQPVSRSTNGSVRIGIRRREIRTQTSPLRRLTCRTVGGIQAWNVFWSDQPNCNPICTSRLPTATRSFARMRQFCSLADTIQALTCRFSKRYKRKTPIISSDWRPWKHLPNAGSFRM